MSWWAARSATLSAFRALFTLWYPLDGCSCEGVQVVAGREVGA